MRNREISLPSGGAGRNDTRRPSSAAHPPLRTSTLSPQIRSHGNRRPPPTYRTRKQPWNMNFKFEKIKLHNLPLTAKISSVTHYFSFTAHSSENPKPPPALLGCVLLRIGRTRAKTKSYLASGIRIPHPNRIPPPARTFRRDDSGKCRLVPDRRPPYRPFRTRTETKSIRFIEIFGSKVGFSQQKSYICNLKNERLSSAEDEFRRRAATAHSTRGEMQEWLNWHAWKACKPLKGFRGSNPLLSAINIEGQCFAKSTPNFTPKNVKSGVLFSPSSKIS